MVWAILRRRRRPKEELLAYVVLGALSGYFIQNLFLFDTPSIMLQLPLLMAWVANQEREPADQEPGQMDREAPPGVGHTAHVSGGLPFQLPVVPWGRWVVAKAIVLLVGFPFTT